MEMETCFAKNKRERKKKERRIAQKSHLISIISVYSFSLPLP